MAKKNNQSEKPEDKRAKFLRLVNPRVNRAVHSISLIGNCASTAYEFTEADVAEIIKALNTSVHLLAERFAGNTSTAGGFKIQ